MRKLSATAARGMLTASASEAAHTTTHAWDGYYKLIDMLQNHCMHDTDPLHVAGDDAYWFCPGCHAKVPAPQMAA